MFRIYDDNAHRDDVLMGVIELNLQSAYENGANGMEVQMKKRVQLPQNPELEGQGYLIFSIRIEVRK
jgi:hypothetical protein